MQEDEEITITLNLEKAFALYDILSEELEAMMEWRSAEGVSEDDINDLDLRIGIIKSILKDLPEFEDEEP